MLGGGLLCGCGSSELSSLVAKQQESEARQVELQATMSDLKKQMQEVGLVARPARGKGQKRGRGRLNNHLQPKQGLDNELSFQATRTGTADDLPELPKVTRVPNTACGFKYKIEALKPISDFVLSRADLGKSSPVVLYEDNKPLPGHAYPKAFEAACEGAFRHAGFVILFSPNGTGPEARKKHNYRIGLADELPLLRGDDARPMYWIYPGTSVTISFETGWDLEWGPMWVDLDAHRAGGLEGAVSVTIQGEEETYESGDVLISTEPDIPDGPWSITISSPSGGPYVLLNRLTIGNPNHALVVTGDTKKKDASS
jgi:hypothetical protein